MATITRQEAVYLANSSQLLLCDNETDVLLKQLADVLAYAASVQQVSTTVTTIAVAQCNVVRQDEVHSTDYRPLMAQAPECEGNYFVVPMILEQK